MSKRTEALSPEGRIAVNLVMSGDPATVLANAAEAGFELDHFLELLGIANGTIDALSLDTLRQVNGIDSAEPDDERRALVPVDQSNSPRWRQRRVGRLGSRAETRPSKSSHLD